jgi:uncharacterized protein YuzE
MRITIQTDHEHDALYVAFSERALAEGSVEKTVRVNDDIALDFDAAGKLLGVEVMNASEHLGSGVDEIDFGELVGVKEAASLLGVQRSNFVRDYADKTDFPRPVAELATGRVWLKSQVEEYRRRRRKSRMAS